MTGGSLELSAVRWTRRKAREPADGKRRPLIPPVRVYYMLIVVCLCGLIIFHVMLS